MLFLAAIIAVFLGMNWYVLARLFALWGVDRDRRLFLLLPPLALSAPLALALEAGVGNALTGGFALLAMTWLGLCFLLLWILLVQQLLSRLFRLPRRVWAVAVCGTAAALLFLAAINARIVTVRRETIPGLPLRIAHLSDIHLGSIGERMLAEIVDRTNDLRPDLVLITGDLFDNANPTTRAAAARLKGFTAPVFFSSGNHETYAGFDRVREMLAGSGIRWLRNEAVESGGIRILGLDDSRTTDRLQEALERLPPSRAFTVLLNHQPVGFDLAVRHRVNLTLSGHVHSGQIWPFGYLVALLYPRGVGLHAVGESFLNVSAGTGYWGPPLRLGSRSEIVLLEPAP